MDGISFTFDESLENVDLSTFKDEFKKLLDFIVKQVSPIIGTKKSFSRDIIKKILLEYGSEDAFTSKISLNKSRIGNLQLQFFMHTPFGVWCILWKKEYESIEKLNSDIEYILDNIYKIKVKETQEEN